MKPLARNTTSAELKVLQSVMEGRGITETSDHLEVSVSTVKFHLTSLYKKHDVKNVRQLYALYIAHYQHLIKELTPDTLPS